jgi:hypothetical protein
MCLGIFEKHKINMVNFESNDKFEMIKSDSEVEITTIQQFIKFKFPNKYEKYEYSIRKNDDIIQIGLFKDSLLRFGAQMDFKISYCYFRDFYYNYSRDTFNINHLFDSLILNKLCDVFIIIIDDYNNNLNSNDYVLK